MFAKVIKAFLEAVVDDQRLKYIPTTVPTKEQLIDWLDRLLVANVFLVLLSFGWFTIALLGRAFKVPLGFDLWHRLWEPVFTPAIGLLMGGAILSGLVREVTKRLRREP